MLSVSELVIFEFSLGKLFTAIEQDSGIVKNKLVLPESKSLGESFFFFSPRGNL